MTVSVYMQALFQCLPSWLVHCGCTLTSLAHWCEGLAYPLHVLLYRFECLALRDTVHLVMHCREVDTAA